MYTTCLHRHRDLGANEHVAAFPVGGRLAFDAARGRLWVVCPHCARWNLTPLEERWEAIETCERLYRGTHRRVATDQVGLAALGGGFDLIRIGQPVRPEFAAWRYGAELVRRQWRDLGGAALTLGASVGGTAGVATAGGCSSASPAWRCRSPRVENEG